MVLPHRVGPDGYSGLSQRGTTGSPLPYVRGHGPGSHHVLAALLDPAFGLPLPVARFRGNTDESYGADQHFIIKDRAGTAALDLRASTEKPSSLMNGTLRQSRLPAQGFTSLETDPLGVLDGVGAH
ncbi:hypothetical protein GCM10010387_65660 [Streptomyces inusitatus]|uniref:Uncharacterized protein n=1 Tax=Streptomyces inusitatus TaxID=68221 RepID=A0A918QS30_9ACTN|nr:hypothetical protein GCM10010387_65660 [Streptomyces inusitatus]